MNSYLVILIQILIIHLLFNHCCLYYLDTFKLSGIIITIIRGFRREIIDVGALLKIAISYSKNDDFNEIQPFIVIHLDKTILS